MDTEEKAKIYNKEYYGKNKAKWIEYNQKKIYCETCCKSVKKNHYSSHEKTKVHTRLMEDKKKASDERIKLKEELKKEILAEMKPII